jgi:hypothetical protein
MILDSALIHEERSRKRDHIAMVTVTEEMN